MEKREPEFLGVSCGRYRGIQARKSMHRRTNTTIEIYYFRFLLQKDTFFFVHLFVMNLGQVSHKFSSIKNYYHRNKKKYYTLKLKKVTEENEILL